MKVKLPESARDRKRSYGGATVSTLVHAVLIGGSVLGTGMTHEVMTSRPERVESLVYVPPRPPEPPRVPQQPPPQQLIMTNVDPVSTLQVQPLNLAIIPTGLPPVGATIGTIREDAFRVAPRDSMPRGPIGPASTEPFTELTVEKAVQPLAGNPSPRYPTLLQASGIEGTVSAQFVVDTMGKVEAVSIAFPRSDHSLFERAVREVLLRSRYVPAEFGGQRVRQLVEQSFTFAIRR